MRVIYWTVLVVLGAAVALGVWNRLAPFEAAAWNVDPLTAPDPGRSGLRYGPDAAPVYAATPEEVLAALDAIIAAAPNTERVAGSPAEGRVTYVHTSRAFAFRDAITITAVPAEGGARPVILARSTLGPSTYDWGTNQARIDSYLAALDARLSRAS